MTHSREQTCRSASSKLRDAATRLTQSPAVIGLDGFVDEIIAVVDKRRDNARYEPIRTIDAFGKKISAAAGASSNYELVVKQMKIGGNGPIMAAALANLGMRIAYVGALGYPNVHGVFEPLASKAAEIISFADPAHTDALEFDDGKLMLGKLTPFDDVRWDVMMQRIGREKLAQLFGGAALVGMVNWTMLPHLSDIWQKLLDENVVSAPPPASRRGGQVFFIDLTDPEKRTRQDIREALELLGRFQERVDVVLGMNLKESTQVADVLEIEVSPSNAEAAIEQTARAIRQKLKLSCVVIHPRRGGAAATERESARFAGPFVRQPKISTGAGDHFNAGFCAAQVLGMTLAESLCIGCAESGYYVRTAQSPSAIELADFTEHLPPPEE